MRVTAGPEASSASSPAPSSTQEQAEVAAATQCSHGAQVVDHGGVCHRALGLAVEAEPLRAGHRPCARRRRRSLLLMRGHLRRRVRRIAGGVWAGRWQGEAGCHWSWAGTEAAAAAAATHRGRGVGLIIVIGSVGCARTRLQRVTEARRVSGRVFPGRRTSPPRRALPAAALARARGCRKSAVGIRHSPPSLETRQLPLL